MVSIIIFLPSVMLSGIMFPIKMLPETFEMAGKLFPASWGYKAMAEGAFQFENLLPLIAILILAICACGILLRKVDK